MTALRAACVSAALALILIFSVAKHPKHKSCLRNMLKSISQTQFTIAQSVAAFLCTLWCAQ